LLISRLKVVNYYRLSGYLYPFREGDNKYKPGTTFEIVWRRYAFDRQLRLQVLDALERVEISLKTALAYEMSHNYDPFGYTESTIFPGLTEEEYSKMFDRLKEEIERSHEVFIKHFNNKYGNEHKYPPFWMIVEVMSFGTMLSIFRGVEPIIRVSIAAKYGITEEVLSSWLRSLNSIRNICAHHGRLWNRELGYKPKIPNKNKEWHDPIEITNNRIFGILSILKYVLAIDAPQSQWPQRLVSLLNKYSDIPLHPMGFPDNWMDSPIWNRKI
jgi:abortive infection bacteriophage resistance protein